MKVSCIKHFLFSICCEMIQNCDFSASCNLSNDLNGHIIFNVLSSFHKTHWYNYDPGTMGGFIMGSIHPSEVGGSDGPLQDIYGCL